MRMVMTAALGLLALAALPVAAEAACPPGWVQICRQTAPDRPPICHCRRASDQPSGNEPWGNRGKAEIHKHNVPTAKPGKSPGPND